MNDIHHERVEIQVGEKTLPITDWHMDWTPLDHAGPMPSPEALASALDVKASYELQPEPGLSHFLEAVMGDYRPRNLEPGVWYHEFLSGGLCVPTTYTIYRMHRQLKAKALKRRQERWKKIRCRQKRAAFRRRKRGMA